MFSRAGMTIRTVILGRKDEFEREDSSTPKPTGTHRHQDQVEIAQIFAIPFLQPMLGVRGPR